MLAMMAAVYNSPHQFEPLLPSEAKQQDLHSGVRRESLRPLHYLFLSGGELERGEFKAMTGLGERTAGSALSALLKRGLLKSDTPQGKVRFGLPLHALRFYFPKLWPEAEADPGAL